MTYIPRRLRKRPQGQGDDRRCCVIDANTPAEWEVIESAARAMFCHEQCDREQANDVEGNWYGRLVEADRAEYRRLAEAAIRAVERHHPGVLP